RINYLIIRINTPFRQGFATPFLTKSVVFLCFFLTMPTSLAKFYGMSTSEIIEELPKLTEADRRAIREVLLEIANQNQDVALCNQSALEGAMMLDRMEDEDAHRQSR